MANVTVRGQATLDEPVLIEGLPGVGLVGKIATDHVIETFGMDYYASVDCDGLPRVAVYEGGGSSVLPPVRIYADEQNDLLALQSDVPVSRTAASDFATCIVEWLDRQDALPLFLSGLPVEDDMNTLPSVYGVATGSAAGLLAEHDIDPPSEKGVVGGPTGALLHQADAIDLGSLGLIVESDPQFPDPAAAKRLIEGGIEPLAGLDVDTDDLVQRAEDIREQKQEFARRMGQADEQESTQATPLRMFQ